MSLTKEDCFNSMSMCHLEKLSWKRQEWCDYFWISFSNMYGQISRKLHLWFSLLANPARVVLMFSNLFLFSDVTSWDTAVRVSHSLLWLVQFPSLHVVFKTDLLMWGNKKKKSCFRGATFGVMDFNFMTSYKYLKCRFMKPWWTWQHEEHVDFSTKLLIVSEACVHDRVTFLISLIKTGHCLSRKVCVLPSVILFLLLQPYQKLIGSWSWSRLG